MRKEEKILKSLELIKLLGQKAEEFSKLKKVDIVDVLEMSNEIIMIQHELIKLRAIKTIN